MSRFALCLIFALMTSIIPDTSMAGGTASGTISTFRLKSNRIFLIAFNAKASGKPACSNNLFAGSAAKPAGATLEDALVSAKASNLTVTVIGTGKCTILSGAEDIASVSIK